MIPHRTLTRVATTALLATAYFAFAAASIGCGSGNDSTTTTTAVVALFTPDTATPAAGTIALLPGSTSGASVNVRVTVTGVPVFFGAAFRIKYDPTALLFNGMTSTASFLLSGPGVTANDAIFLAQTTANAGEIVITATLKDPTVVGPVVVTTTSDLVVLNFVARRAITPAAAAGRLDFGDPKQVCDGTVTPPGCGAVAVAWSGGGVSAQ